MLRSVSRGKVGWSASGLSSEKSLVCSLPPCKSGYTVSVMVKEKKDPLRADPTPKFFIAFDNTQGGLVEVDVKNGYVSFWVPSADGVSLYMGADTARLPASVAGQVEYDLTMSASPGGTPNATYERSYSAVHDGVAPFQPIPVPVGAKAVSFACGEINPPTGEHVITMGNGLLTMASYEVSGPSVPLAMPSNVNTAELVSGNPQVITVNYTIAM